MFFLLFRYDTVKLYRESIFEETRRLYQLLNVKDLYFIHKVYEIESILKS